MSSVRSGGGVDVAVLRARPEAVGQGHVLSFWDRLSEGERAALAGQIGEIRWEGLPGLVEAYVRNKPRFELPDGIEPALCYSASGGATGNAIAWDRAAMRRIGEDLIRRGKVMCFTVAGGQGSRLGYEGPKGCYPAGVLTGRPLFQFFAEQIVASQRKWGGTIRWAIMTSPLNHASTVEFFESHRHFGLGREQVMFFPQGVMPSFDRATGMVLMASRGEIATNPDGHGGSITALHRSGVLSAAAGAGVEHVSYFQVDNPIVRALDPEFLGLHAAAGDPRAASSGEMSSKMIPKAHAGEKLGMFCRAGGRTQVIEYSDLPMEQQRETLPDGSLKFLAGSIAVHAMSVEFLRRLNENAGFDLPYHRADKKVACIDPLSGDRVEPAEPNGVKLERFVFDALPLCRGSIVLETSRQEEFAPIKNAEGADSPASSAQIQTERAAAWLERAGVAIPRRADGAADCVIELSPLTACEATDLERAEVRGRLPVRIAPGDRIAL